MVNKVFCAIKFAGRLVDTGTILGVLKKEIGDGLMIYLMITNQRPYKEFYPDKNEGEIRFTTLATDFGNFETN